MRFGYLMTAVLMLASPAFAASCPGSSEVVSVTEWAIEPLDGSTNLLTVTVRNDAPAPIRMIDGSVGFSDALGASIASYAIDRDASIPIGGTFTQEGRWGPYTFERLLKLRKDEVTAWTCVRAVLYEDGTKEQF